MKKLLALALLIQSALAQEKTLVVERVSVQDTWVSQTKNLKAFQALCAQHQYELPISRQHLLVNNEAIQKTLDGIVGDDSHIVQEMESAFNDYQKEYLPDGMPTNQYDIKIECESGYVMGIELKYFGQHHGAHHFEWSKNYFLGNETLYEHYELLTIDNAGHILPLEKFIKKEAYPELQSALLAAYKEFCPTELKSADDLLKPAGFNINLDDDSLNFLYRKDSPNDCLETDMILSIPLNKVGPWFQHIKS